MLGTSRGDCPLNELKPEVKRCYSGSFLSLCSSNPKSQDAERRHSFLTMLVLANNMPTQLRYINADVSTALTEPNPHRLSRQYTVSRET